MFLGQNEMYKAFAAYWSTMVDGNPEEKHLCDWVVSQTDRFSHETLFLLERTIDKLQLFRLGYLSKIFLKTNEVTNEACHFKENNEQNLFPVTKFKLSRENSKIGQVVIYHCSLKVLKTLQWCISLLSFFFIILYKEMSPHLGDAYLSEPMFSIWSMIHVTQTFVSKGVI